MSIPARARHVGDRETVSTFAWSAWCVLAFERRQAQKLCRCCKTHCSLLCGLSQKAGLERRLLGQLNVQSYPWQVGLMALLFWRSLQGNSPEMASLTAMTAFKCRNKVRGLDSSWALRWTSVPGLQGRQMSARQPSTKAKRNTGVVWQRILQHQRSAESL